MEWKEGMNVFVCFFLCAEEIWARGLSSLYTPSIRSVHRKSRVEGRKKGNSPENYMTLVVFCSVVNLIQE